jgi:hypothetical protein
MCRIYRVVPKVSKGDLLQIASFVKCCVEIIEEPVGGFMKSWKVPILIFFIFHLFACAAGPDKGAEQPVKLFAVEGVVLDSAAAELTLSVQIPNFPKTSDSVTADIAAQVVRKSYLLEGTKIAIDGHEGTITEVRGNQVKITFSAPLPFPVGRRVAVQVPKKTIAVVDFEVLGGNRREKGRVVLEGLTSALIDTGQFIVVERTKLQPIMNEIQLSLSGMTKTGADGLAGKLLSADLILTGALTDLQDEWDINLRILNVRTGQALSALSMRTRLFKQTEMRDSGAWAEDFEGSALDPSWFVRSAPRGKQKTKRSFSVRLDPAQGAEDSHQSLRIDFDFSGPMDLDFYATAGNQKKRDLALYSGAEFYVKGTDALVGQFYIMTSHPDDPNKIDMWTGVFNVDTAWKKVRVPFAQMGVARGWIKQGAKKRGATPGDQVMRLNRIEGVQFGLGSERNEGVSGSLWIDKVHFYNN